MVGLVMFCALLFPAALAGAHNPGFSSVQVDIGEAEVNIELWLPLDVFSEATGLRLDNAPSEASFRSDVLSYIENNIGIRGSQGDHWTETVGEPIVITQGDGEILRLGLSYASPGTTVEDFELLYSIIIDDGIDHRAIIGVTNDAEGIIAGATIGGEEHIVAITARGGAIEVRASFVDLVLLGYEHVVEGADHILFLIVLILPAPLRVGAERRWVEGTSVLGMASHILLVSLAFMFGHSVTLALGTFEWVSAPLEPVEVAIAGSIAFGALHAIIPLFRRGELVIAAGFGLIHGLAFAEILDSLSVGGSSPVLTLLGFNLGVELAQFGAVSLLFPGLLILSKSRYYKSFRLAMAAFSLALALGWVGDRLDLFNNPLEPIEDWTIENPLLTIASFTVIATVLYVASQGHKKTIRGVFPGSFNPLTIAHLAVVEKAREDHSLTSVDLMISEVALDKPEPPGPPLPDRVTLIEKDIAHLPWLSVRTTKKKLIADIADGYDAVLMGADKWAQVNDVAYYGSEAARNRAVASLPLVIVADRSGHDSPAEHRLETDQTLHDVSSTKAREGDRSIMAPIAADEWQ